MGISNVKAIVMAAGPGRRMGRITSFGEGLRLGNLPKPALPIVNRPIVCRAIDQLVARGVTDFWVTSHHMAGDIVKVIGHGETFGAGVKIQHIVEFPLVHTALATKQISEAFGEKEPFWVLSGDIFCPHTDFTSFFKNFEAAQKLSKRVAGSVGFILRPAEDILNRYTTAVIDADGRVQSFEEPPTSMKEAEEIFGRTGHPLVKKVSDELGKVVLPINSSTYLLTRRIFEIVAEPETNPFDLYDFGKFIFRKLPPKSIASFFIPESIVGKRVQKLWTDVGFPEDLWLANFRLRKYAPFLIGGKFITHFKSWIGHNCNLQGRVSRSVIGSNVQVGPGVKIEDSVIGQGSIIEDAKLIRGTVILPYSYINVRKNHHNIQSIKNSLIISRSRGGTFLDSQTTSAQEIEKQVTIPDIDGQNKLEPLYLSPQDIRELLSR